MIAPWIVALIVALSAAIGVGSRFYQKKTDTVIEEIAEVVIQKVTDIDVDLSPDTPDKDLPSREKSYVMDMPIDVDEALADLPSELPQDKVLKKV